MEQHHYEALIQDIHEIKSAIIGNEITKDGGLVGRLKHVEEKVEELNEFKDKSKWTVTILIGFAGILGWVADKLISLFTSNH